MGLWVRGATTSSTILVENLLALEPEEPDEEDLELEPADPELEDPELEDYPDEDPELEEELDELEPIVFDRAVLLTLLIIFL